MFSYLLNHHPPTVIMYWDAHCGPESVSAAAKVCQLLLLVSKKDNYSISSILMNDTVLGSYGIDYLILYFFSNCITSGGRTRKIPLHMVSFGFLLIASICPSVFAHSVCLYMSARDSVTVFMNVLSMGLCFHKEVIVKGFLEYHQLWPPLWVF